MVFMTSICVVGPVANASNLVSNGGFESVVPGISVGTAPYFRYLYNGDSTTLPGWTIKDDGIGEPSYVYDMDGYQIGDGLNSLSINQGSSITTTIVLQLGQAYKFSMLMTNANPGWPPYSLDITAGTVAHSFTLPSGSFPFHMVAFYFVATSTGSANLLIANNASVGDYKNYVIDDVSVQAVRSVPGPMGIVTFGIGMVGALRRRSSNLR